MEKLNCKYIKNLRTRSVGKSDNGMSREELSFMIDVSTRTIQRLENDPDFNPGIRTVARLAKFFNVSLDSLIRYTN